MASQSPVAPAPVTLLVRSKQLAIETVQSIIKDVDLNECFEHEIESLGEVWFLYPNKGELLFRFIFLLLYISQV